MAVNFTIGLRAMFDKWSNKHQGYPIYLTISFEGDRIPSFQNTGIYIQSREQWDVKKLKVKAHNDAQLFNDTLDNARVTKRNQLLGMAIVNKEVSKTTIKHKVTVPRLYEYIKSVRGDNEFTQNCIKNIKLFTKREPLITDVTAEWVRLCEKYYRDELKYHPNTINKNMKIIRRVTNQAVIAGYLPKKVIGEGAHEIQKQVDTDPVFLVEDERLRVLALLTENKITDPSVRKTLIYFLLSCYSGLRFSDISKFEISKHIIGDFIVLRTTKTNDRVVYELTKTLVLLMGYIKEVGVLNQCYNRYSANLKVIQKQLKINKKLTSHVGRHSFGRMMAEVGTTQEHCAYFMGIKVSTCAVYYHISGKIINKLNTHLKEAC